MASRDLLLSDDPIAATEGLDSFARALGQLHAFTASRRGAYEGVRGRLGPRPEHDPHFAFERFMPAFAKACASVDVQIPSVAGAEIDGVVSRMTDDACSALTHGDPCPDNTRIVGNRTVLIDFELGDFRHALLDGVYGQVPFPTCWCVNRLPAQVTRRMEHAYQDEVANTFPMFGDQQAFTDEVVTAMAFWAMSVSGWQIPAALERDESMHRDVHTRRQGALLRWELFCERAEASGRLEAIAALGRTLIARLYELWPGVDAMPLYPAFR